MPDVEPVEPVQPPTPPAPLFHEDGASWYWLLSGPAVALAMVLMQKSIGVALDALVPGIFLVMVSGFVAIQVKAARIHTSVELTEQTLRQGTEIIRIGEIVKVFPEAERPAYRTEKPEKWQMARALGELKGVPRGRVGIGLRLTGGRTAQAWARGHRALRAALVPLVLEHGGPDEPELDDYEGYDGMPESQW